MGRQPASGGEKLGKRPFWREKNLSEMTTDEWESLCDGCAKCCLLKLEDEDTGDFHYTDVACQLLDHQTCRCIDYKNRKQKVPGCVVLTPKNIASLKWMPSTCAYRLIFEGKDLFPWHPLISGDAKSVHDYNVSVFGKVVAEHDIPEDDLEVRIVDWAE